MTKSQTLDIFVTDLDNTLVGDPGALRELNDWLQAARASQGTKIVYATGRSLTSYRSLAIAERLLAPDALIAAVGTEIYLEGGGDIPWSLWEEKIGRGWQRAKIQEIATQFADLRPQISSEQRPYKLSYYLTEAAAIETIPRLRQELRQQSLMAEIIYSGQRDLDIIPKASNKGAAVQFLQQQWAVTNGVACGDSGNDISLFSYDLPYGILVGNAHQELLLWYELNATERHYLAHAHCSRGILEGLQYFGFL